MQDIATRERCAEAPSRDLWQSIPLDLIVSGLAILIAAGLTLAGVMPS